jgi:cytochrome c oxidase assembly protein subunit 11
MSSSKFSVAAVAVLAVAGMIGLVAASEPLYRAFCKATGTGGTPRIAAAAPGVEAGGAEAGRTMVVRFDASVIKGMPWTFEPETRQVTVHLGEQTLALFRATNTSGADITGTASFNVVPAKAGRYFDKIQCFCFTEQHLAAGQSAEMPVSFFVDPKIAEDPDTADIGTITLAYTFFPKPPDRGLP